MWITISTSIKLILLLFSVEEDECEVEEILDHPEDENKDHEEDQEDREDSDGNQDCIAIEMQGRLYIMI